MLRLTGWYHGGSQRTRRYCTIDHDWEHFVRFTFGLLPGYEIRLLPVRLIKFICFYQVLGFCMISASWGRNLSPFNAAVADTLSSLMIIATMAIILPTVLASTLTAGHSQMTARIVTFSRGTSIILLVMYVCYIYFQMKTHAHLFERADNAHENNTAPHSAHPAQHANIYMLILILIVSSTGVVVCTYFVFQSMAGASHTLHISISFIATILIPIASNSPEGSAVIAASQRGDIDFAISVIVSSILQISLFVIPFLVILGWMAHQQITLRFDSFNTMILFFSVLAVSYMLREGRYTYIHGVMLVGL